MKKKILGITLAVCLLVLSIAGSTLAYFTSTDAKATVFTSGNVTIEFTNTADTFAETVTNLYPGQVIEVDTEIRNVGSMDAYVGAIITLEGSSAEKNISAIFEKIAVALDTADIDDATAFFGGLTRTDYFTLKFEEVSATKCKVYVAYNFALAKNATIDFFSSINIPAKWGNDDMKAFDSIKISVDAYATQTVGFAGGTTPAEALAEAFSAFAVFAPVQP